MKRIVTLLLSGLLLAGFSARAQDSLAVAKKDSLIVAKKDSLTVARDSAAAAKQLAEAAMVHAAMTAPTLYTKKGTRLCLDGEKLPKEVQYDILAYFPDEDFNARWHKDKVRYGAGIGMIAGGATLATASFFFSGVYLIGAAFAGGIAGVGGEEAAQDAFDSVAVYSGLFALGGLAFSGVMATGIVMLCRANKDMREIVEYCNTYGRPIAAGFDFGPTASGGVGLTYNF